MTGYAFFNRFRCKTNVLYSRLKDVRLTKLTRLCDVLAYVAVPAVIQRRDEQVPDDRLRYHL